MWKIGTMTFLLFYSLKALAIFCPSNYVNIKIGDSLQDVIAQCGTPKAILKYDNAPKVVSNDPALKYLNKPAHMTNLVYEGTPSVTLVFENSRLKEQVYG